MSFFSFLNLATELLDLTMNLSTAAQELIGALKAEPADASRTRTHLGRFLSLLKAGAERYSLEKEKEDKCTC